MIKRIHVNRHNVAYNKKHTNDPDFVERMPFTVKTYKDNIKGNRVWIKGDVQLVYQPSKPLSCGAVAWMETTGKVYVNTVDFSLSLLP